MAGARQPTTLPHDLAHARLATKQEVGGTLLGKAKELDQIALSDSQAVVGDAEESGKGDETIARNLG